MSELILPYSEARPLIQEGDILLFRAPEWHLGDLLRLKFPGVGWWIATYGKSVYSHVGLAHWDKGRLFCVEQREFKGGRSVSLTTQVIQNPGRIDIYRAVPELMLPKVEKVEIPADGKTGTLIEWERKFLDEATLEAIINEALDMTGTGYGWKVIWNIVRGYLPFFRWVNDKLDDKEISRAYVCSTIVNYSYRLHYADPCPMINDDMTQPGDIARSAIFHKLFTIGDV